MGQETVVRVKYRVTVRDTHWAHVVVEAESKAAAHDKVQWMDDNCEMPRLDFHTGTRLVLRNVKVEPEPASYPPNEDDIPY